MLVKSCGGRKFREFGHVASVLSSAEQYSYTRGTGWGSRGLRSAGCSGEGQQRGPPSLCFPSDDAEASPDAPAATAPMIGMAHRLGRTTPELRRGNPYG